MSQRTDEQLFEHYRSGDHEAFAELVRRYENMLFSFLFRFLNSESLAQDVFQETFLQVHQSAETFAAGKKFKPWLYTIAANKARDKIRSQKRRPERQISTLDSKDEGESLWDLLASDDLTADVIFEKKQTQQQVKAVIANMPAHLREILMLAYFEQVSYKEIAETLDIPLGTVKSRLHAAVAAFAKGYLHSQSNENR